MYNPDGYLKVSKNRVEMSSLRAELNRIESEKRNEIRMHDNAAKRFRAKYSKFKDDPDSIVKEASDVKMYETHNPGFCYKRNGQQKIPQTVISAPSVDFEKLRNMLFSNGELDTDKVLCLRLLSAHNTETLKPPEINAKTAKYVSKENSPLERLIQRSKTWNKGGKNRSNRLIRLLPTYIIDVETSKVSITSLKKRKTETLIRDGRLAARLLVNEKVSDVIHTVLKALKQSNTEKLYTLLEKSKDVEYIKKIFQKSKILDFVRGLKAYPILTSCESYSLTPKFKVHPIHLEIRTTTGTVENLLNQIRYTVLQIPTKTTWKDLYENEILEEEVVGSLLPGPGSVRSSKLSYAPNRRFGGQSCVSVADGSLKRKLDEIESGKLGKHEFKNFVRRNIREAANYRRIENVDDVHDVLSIRTSLSSLGSARFRSKDYIPPNILGYTMPPRLLRLLGSDDPTNEIREEGLPTKNSETSKESKESSTEDKNTLSTTSSDERRSFIRHTTCSACMEKWKTPLPSPKTPRLIKHIPDSAHSYPNPYKTNALNRLSAQISHELYKLSSYDTRYSVNNLNNVRPAMDRDCKREQCSMDCCEICNRDLAKLSQEIANKETVMKLRKFLSEKV